jgi:hypothetical protein
VPKKAHGRPAKARNRTRRPPARPGSPSGATPSGQGDLVAERVPVSTAATASIQSRSAVTAGAPASSARRGGAAVRRPPTTVINYQYLRRDITTLTILAPAMIVVLVILFFVLHY